MRLAAITPSSPDEIRAAVIEDLDALVPGARVVATAVPLADGGAIDLLAADGRGRLTLVVCATEAGPPEIFSAVAQWDWTTRNLGLLRALAPAAGLDLSREPRLLLVAGSVPEEVRRFAGYVDRPEVEIVEATLVAAGEVRGVLLRRSAAPGRRPGADGLADLLSGLPAGEARSLARRVMEELRDAPGGEAPLAAAALTGGIDLRRHERAVASLVAAPAGLELRIVDPEATRPISNDAECREAARFLAAPARPAPPEALTPEEIAEFGRLDHSAPERPEEAEAPAVDPPAVQVAKTGFMEN